MSLPCEPKEQDGFLESSKSAVGNILLTPFGKKAIADARESLSAMTNTSPASVPEDLIWKHLIHAIPTSDGVKRGRPSIRQGHDESDLVSDGPARPKRRRISTLIAYSPDVQNSRVTKSQLQAELRALQKEKENGLWLRESSPLTDLDLEEEVARLRDELKEKKEEIERIKQELTEAKTNDNFIPSMNQSYRPSTPEMHTRPSSPTRPSSRMPTHSRALDLVRTHSGSCISLLSRRPTPPCSPGAASDAILDTTGIHEGGFVMQEDCVQAQIAVGAATSAITSISNDSKVIELERDVASRVVTIENLEAQLSQVQENLAAAQRALLERDERLSVLSTSFSNLQTDASRKTIDLERQIAELRKLESLKAGLESAQSSRLAHFQHELNERKILIKTISQDREKGSAEVALLRDSLTAAERDKSTLASRLADTETQVQNYRSEVAEQQRAADNELQSQRSANSELEGKVEALLTRISALDQEVQVLQQSKNTTSMLLREAEANNESLSGQLTTTMDEKSELQAALGIYKDLVSMLYTRLKVSKIATGKRDVTPLPQQVTTASTLKSELALSKQSTNDLTAKLVTIMDERVELLSELDKTRATISASASSIAHLEDRLVTTEDDLVKAKNTAAESQAKLNATTDELNSQQERNQALVAEVELKQAEFAWLAQRLSAAESLTEQYRAELVTSRTTTQELQKQMSAAENELKTAHDLLLSTQDNHMVEIEKQATRISDLEVLAQRERTEIDALQLRLSSTQSEKVELQKQVVERTLELGKAKTKLVAGSQRVTSLEAELVIATEKLQEAEEELSELRSSKAADEATIETMKEMFSTHVEKQTQSLAVLNSQITSTKSSPVPPKRRSTRTMTKVPIPFKLT
ncbi:hypothetical protein C0995_003632 [Termitomyces sp. Mi166|nr:hypothetical protein C0995_003632 [Termitomyces sp. Mi166\